MLTCSGSVLISKELKQVYEIAERYPTFVDYYKRKEIICSDEKYSEVRIEANFLGFSFVWEGKGAKERNNRIAWTQSKGLLKGMKADWMFFEVGHSTRVSLTATYESSIPLWEHVAMLLFIRNTVPKVLGCLKIACERL